MKKIQFIIIMICSLLWLVYCFPRRKKGATIKIINKATGEATAVDNLIQKYEKEHQKFYDSEAQCGAYLEWPALNDKNLSKYCSDYLQQSVPIKRNGSIVGIRIGITLSYREEYININSIVVLAIQCKVLEKTNKYYITRAPERNCVYSLKRTRDMGEFIFMIINKHCDFEDNPSWHLKRKRLEIIGQINRKSGQPIAKDKYLLQYELEHQEMLEKEGKAGGYIEWVYAVTYPNLNSFCYQYMEECVPGRNRDGVNGSWKINKLQYQKLHGPILKTVNLIIVTCVTPKPTKRRYYITRAPEPNCVYALLLQKYNVPNYALGHYIIVFKHCDFEDVINQKITSHDHGFPDENIIPKTDTKKEPFDTLESIRHNAPKWRLQHFM